MCRTPSHPTTRTPAPPGRAVRSSCRPPPQPYRGPPAERLPRGRATPAAYSPAPLASRKMSLPVWSEPRRLQHQVEVGAPGPPRSGPNKYQRGGDPPSAYNDNCTSRPQHQVGVGAPGPPRRGPNACNDNCTHRPHVEDGARRQHSPPRASGETLALRPLSLPASRTTRTRDDLSPPASAVSHHHHRPVL